MGRKIQITQLWREREREMGKEDLYGERQTDRQIYRQSDRYRDRQADRDRDGACMHSTVDMRNPAVYFYLSCISGQQIRY